MPIFDQKLLGDMSLLVFLSGFQITVRMQEIGARILKIQTQEGLIHLMGQIIVMRDILSGYRGGIQLLEEPQ